MRGIEGHHAERRLLTKSAPELLLACGEKRGVRAGAKAVLRYAQDDKSDQITMSFSRSSTIRSKAFGNPSCGL